MIMDIFLKEQADSVVRVSMGNEFRPAFVQLYNTGGSLIAMDFAVIKNIQVESAAAYSMDKALREKLYINTFGSVDTAINVSGMAFGRVLCDGNRNSGLSSILEVFQRLNVSNVGSDGTVPLISISLLGQPVYSGFLVKCTLGVADTAGTPANFSLVIIGATANRV